MGYQGTYVQLATEGLHGGPGDSLFAKYAGGADGVLIRALLKKTGAKKWQCAMVDVKTAFLLAPRREADTKLLTVRPPKIFQEAGIGELTSSPSNSNTYRHDVLKMLQWDCDRRKLQLLATPEPKLVKVVTVGGPDDEEALGFLAPGTLCGRHGRRGGAGGCGILSDLHSVGMEVFSA